MAYQYKGTNMGKGLKPHGTRAAYMRHHRAGETPCDPCIAGNSADSKAKRHASNPPRVLQPCGTVAAYVRHIRNGEKACEPCKEANRQDYQQRKAAA